MPKEKYNYTFEMLKGGAGWEDGGILASLIT